MEIKFRHDIFLHFVAPQPDTTVLAAISDLKGNLMSIIQTLIDRVAASETVTDGVVVLLTGVKAQLQKLIDDAAGNAVDTAKLQELADRLDGNTSELAAAAATFNSQPIPVEPAPVEPEPTPVEPTPAEPEPEQPAG